jgi:hypothetical protein
MATPFTMTDDESDPFEQRFVTLGVGRWPLPIRERNSFRAHFHLNRWVKTFEQFNEELMQENSYDDVLRKHSYSPKNPEENHWENGIGHHVEISPEGGWEHKGKNKKQVGTTGESHTSLDRHLRGVGNRLRAATTQKARENAMKTLGLTRVKGSQGGTYWE